MPSPLTDGHSLGAVPKVLRHAAIALVASTVLWSCGGGGGSSEATYTLRGKLSLQQESPQPSPSQLAQSSQQGAGEDAEPNDHVFSALDLGALDDGFTGASSSGAIGTSSDSRDLVRIGPVSRALAGRVLRLSVRSQGARVVVYETSRLAPAFELESDSTLHLPLREGDDFVVSMTCARPGQRAQWSVEASLAERDVLAAARVYPQVEAGEALAIRSAALGGDAFRFAPGEVLVNCVSAAPAMQAMGFEKLAGDGDVARWRRIGDVQSTDLATSQLEQANLLRTVRRELPAASWVSPNVITSLDDALAGAPRAEMAAALAKMKTAASSRMTEPNDLFWKNDEQFNLRLTNFEDAWSITTGSDDVHIAVVDTGMQVGHPDLAPRVSSFGYDFVADKDSAGDGDGIDADPTEPDEFDIYFFHGTYVGGVAAAVANNSIGVAGGTWKGKVIPIRIFGKLGGTSYDRIQAYRYLAGETNDSGRILPEKERPKVINMSFAIRIPTAAEHTEIKKLYAQNVKMVAAIDNQGFDPAPPLYPAAWDEVLCCAAVDEKLVRTTYSNAADYVDICAPGGTEIAGPKGVVSTWAFRDPTTRELKYLYNSFLGTSVATPAVSAALALMESVHPDLHPELARRILAQTSQDLGPTGKDRYYGHGLLLADEAVKLAQSLNKDPVMTLTPQALRIGNAETKATLVIGNDGGRLLENLSISSSAKASGALDFEMPRFAPNDIVVTLDRSRSLVGNNQEFFVLGSNAGKLALDVSWRTPIPTAPSQFVIWLSRDGRFVRQTQSATDGSFTVEGLSAGTYFMEAGVDRDKNGRLGDAQEWYLGRTIVVSQATTGNLGGVIPWKN